MTPQPVLLKIELPPVPPFHPATDPLAVAVTAELVDRGYTEVTIGDLLRRAGVSEEEFFRRFSDLEDCILQTLEAHIAIYKRRVGGAFNRHREWRAALRAAAYETADWIAEDPKPIQFGMTEVLKLRSEMPRVRREEAFTFCARMIDAGRPFAPDPAAVPESASLIATGSVLQFLSHNLQAGEHIRPHEIVPELMFGVVRVYLGKEAAHDELAMPPQAPPPTT